MNVETRIESRPNTKTIDIANWFIKNAAIAYPDVPIEQALAENLFFVTINFRYGAARGKSGPAVAVEEAARWYTKVVRRTFKCRHIERKIQFQPLGVLYADFDGTRKKTNAGADLLKGRAHVHGLILLRPGEGQMIRNHLLLSAFKKHDAIADILIKKYDPSIGSVEDLVSYCMKGYRELPSNCAEREEAWAVLPPIRAKARRKRSRY